MNVLNLALTVGVTYLLLLGASLGSMTYLLPYLPFLLIAFSFPHFLATYWIWIKRIKSVKDEIWPLLFPLIYIGLFIYGPIPISIIVKLSYSYLIYHFSQQLYGVALWSTSKGLTLARWEKHFLRTYFLVNGFYALLDFERRGVAKVLFYYETPSLEIPASLIIGTFSLSLILLALILGRIGYLFLKTSQKSLFVLIAFVGLSLVWFVPPFSYEMVLFLPIIHALQFLPLARLKLSKVSKVEWISGVFSCLILGWFFFRFLPHMEFRYFSHGIWPVLVLTLLNNHHFIIEGRIWKLRDPQNSDLS